MEPGSGRGLTVGRRRGGGGDGGDRMWSWRRWGFVVAAELWFAVRRSSFVVRRASFVVRSPGGDEVQGQTR